MNSGISEFLDERISAGDFPSAVWRAAENGEVVASGALGNAVLEPEQIASGKDTIYDLASLTKPLVTGLLLAKLIEAGEIQLDSRVAIYLPEFEVEGKRMITILDLATHTSHLPAWRPLYLLCEGPDVIRQIAATPLDMLQPAVTYSDLGFIVLGRIIERFHGAPLGKIAAEQIFDPLGLTDTFFNPPEHLRTRIAASEKGNAFERQVCVDQGFDVDNTKGPLARSEVVWGEVHDVNAHFLGGAAGHAGLFSTAAETLKIAEQFLPDRSTLFKPETCELFTTNFTAGQNEHRSIGFQLASTPDSAAGTSMSPQSFGHLGFTGTSVWIDPVLARTFILLTNRTHMRPPPFVNINSVRRRFHDLAIELMDQNR